MAIEWMTRYVEAWNSHDGEQVAEFMAPDVFYEDLAASEPYRGRAGVHAFIDAAHSWSADYRLEPVTMQESGDRYALEWVLSGTNTGAAGGMPATHEPYRIRGVSVGRRDTAGQIVENRDYWNVADYMTQVGLLPRPHAG